MADKKDYYEVLGLNKGATDAEIKSAYRKKAKELHPDLNKDDPHAEDKFKEVQEAYSVLSDDNKKRMYDQFGHAGVSGNGPTGGNPYGGAYTNFDASDFDFGDIFDSIFLNIQLRHELLAAAQGCLERHCQSGHDRINSFVVQFRETQAYARQEFMTCMLDIMLIIGIVDNALKVAFIVAHLHLQFKYVFFHILQIYSFLFSFKNLTVSVSNIHIRCGNTGISWGRSMLSSAGSVPDCRPHGPL